MFTMEVIRKKLFSLALACYDNCGYIAMGRALEPTLASRLHPEKEWWVTRKPKFIVISLPQG